MSGMKDLFGDEPFQPPKTYGYPASPGWKEPTTSRDAATVAEKTAETYRALALAAITEASPYPGLTADETAARMGVSILTIRPRVSELAAAGKIVRTGEKRANKSGLRAAVWRIA